MAVSHESDLAFAPGAVVESMDGMAVVLNKKIVYGFGRHAHCFGCAVLTLRPGVAVGANRDHWRRPPGRRGGGGRRRR